MFHSSPGASVSAQSYRQPCQNPDHGKDACRARGLALQTSIVDEFDFTGAAAIGLDDQQSQPVAADRLSASISRGPPSRGMVDLHGHNLIGR
jgi:hypothetical protein